jgi:hypothetical protein
LLLNGHIIDSRLVVCISGANGYIAAASPQQDNIRLPWQTCAAAPVRISAAQETRVDAGEDVLELAWVAAPVVLDLGEVDVEESVVGQVGRSTVDDSRGDVQCKIGIDLAVERRRSVPCSWVACLARESDGWDLGCLCGICCSANGTGEG